MEMGNTTKIMKFILVYPPWDTAEAPAATPNTIFQFHIKKQ